MRAGEVVVVQPGLQVLVALLGVGPVTRVSPLAQGGLDEAFGFAVGARSIGAGEAVTKAELQAGLAELAGAISRAVIGEQGANADAVLGIEVQGLAQEVDGGGGLLVGQQLGEGEAGVVVDGDVQGYPAEVSMAGAAASAITTNGNPLKTGHSLDVEMQQIAGERMLIALYGRGGMKVTPAAESGTTEDAADGGRTESGGTGDVIGRTLLPPQFDDALG